MINNNKFYSIEFLRGILALIVCISHFYIFENKNILFEFFSSLAVEIFFIISGFVLSPIIISIYKENNVLKKMKIFFLRRFIRTLPLYFFFLILTSVFFNQIFNLSFIKYFFFINNFFSITPKDDYYSVVWSLSIEEWFYISFLPSMFFLKKIIGCNSLLKNILMWILFFIFCKLFFTTEYSHKEILDIRRITFFRMDSIAYGILLYYFQEKILKLNLIFLFTTLIVLIFFLFCENNFFSFRLLSISKILILSLMSIIIFMFFYKNELIFKKKIIKKISILLGRTSYGIYLNHVLVFFIIKKIKIISTEYLIIYFLSYLVSVFMLALITRIYIEEIFLKFRPKY